MRSCKRHTPLWPKEGLRQSTCTPTCWKMHMDNHAKESSALQAAVKVGQEMGGGGGKEEGRIRNFWLLC